MEDEFIKKVVEIEANKCSEKELEENLDQINDSMQNIEKLLKEKDNKHPYIRGSIKQELKDILEILPEEVKVLCISKDIYVSRAQEKDKIIRVWQIKDLEEYTLGIEELFTTKALEPDMSFPKRWE